MFFSPVSWKVLKQLALAVGRWKQGFRLLSDYRAAVHLASDG